VKLRCKDRILALDRVVIMGVLNVTPDSFSDGGLWFQTGNAVVHARRMVDQGAAVIDVGGESTRPGAQPVAEDEELRRVIPVIEALAELDVLISIDTRKATVARRAVEAGASIVNDTLGEESEGSIDRVAAETGAAIAVMHSRGTPLTMKSLNQYGDVVTEVATFLRDRAASLQEMGVASDAIVLDPGFGFAKDAGQNLEMLRRLDEFVKLGYPVLAGTSRKSFIGQTLDLPEDQRLEGTIATVIWAVAKGARMVRVHDVEEVGRALKMVEAIENGSGG
jgi:dihydropteroate synthase